MRVDISLCMYTTSVSQSNATKCTRELLVKEGFDGSCFTEESFKVQGVTQLLDSGEPLENVMVSGGGSERRHRFITAICLKIFC